MNKILKINLAYQNNFLLTTVWENILDYFNLKFYSNFILDPPGEPNLTTQHRDKPDLDIQGVWWENQNYTIRCNSDPGNPTNKYRLMINGNKIHEGPEYTITAHRDQKVLVCEVYNKFTEDKQKPKSVTYNINVHCESTFYL